MTRQPRPITLGHTCPRDLAERPYLLTSDQLRKSPRIRGDPLAGQSESTAFRLRAPAMHDHSVRLWLPDGLDLTARMARAGLANKVAYGEWLVSVVAKRTQADQGTDRFFGLATTFLEAGVPRNLLSRLKTALGDVIESDESYRPFNGFAFKSLGYRLTAPYRDRQLVPITRTAPELAKKLHVSELSQRANLDRYVAGLPEIHQAIYSGMRAYTLEANTLTSADPIIDHLGGQQRRWFTVCDQGRVHHPVANCPSRLRPYLRCATTGKAPAMVDVSTSQPLLLGLTVQNLKIRDKDFLHLRSSPAQAPIIVSPYSGGCQYVDDCLAGRMYERVQAEMIDRGHTDTPISRDEAKSMCIKCVYGRPELMHRTLAGRSLCYLYPRFMETLQKLTYQSPHGELARQMQRLESDLMIGEVAPRVRRQFPIAPLVTVHDAVMCDGNHAEDVKSIMASAWKEQLNVEPRLKVTDYAQ